MEFEDYWEKLTKKNPDLEPGNTIRLSVMEFRKQLERSHREGRACGKAERPSLFESIFGN